MISNFLAMNFLQAIILGIVQGLTEFIPISSTAHLIFAERLMGVYADNAEQLTAAIAVVQLGTLFAVFVYFARDIWSISTSFVGDHLAFLGLGQKRYFQHRNAFRPTWMSDETWLGWLIVFGSIPIGVVGIALKKIIEGSLTKNLWLIAAMMVAVAILLAAAELIGSKKREIRQFGVFDALAQGLAQCLALIPGASRSGSTMMGGLFAGQTRESAARFSFLLSIPAILASGLLELKEAFGKIPFADFPALGIGVLVAGIVGYSAIWFLLWYFKKRSNAIFIVYRLIVGTIILACLWQGFLKP
jgi:undecaprenyl-diphosphatase